MNSTLSSPHIGTWKLKSLPASCACTHRISPVSGLSPWTAWPAHRTPMQPVGSRNLPAVDARGRSHQPSEADCPNVRIRCSRLFTSVKMANRFNVPRKTSTFNSIGYGMGNHHFRLVPALRNVRCTVDAVLIISIQSDPSSWSKTTSTDSVHQIKLYIHPTRKLV